MVLDQRLPLDNKIPPRISPRGYSFYLLVRKFTHPKFGSWSDALP
jgi:hypothetical protein